MTLYEEYENDLDLKKYIKNAYNNLKKAVYLTIKNENIYDEKDIQILWEYILDVGNIECITEDMGARDLVRMSFKMYGSFIDSKLLSMVRDYESMSIDDFLNLYSKEKEVKKEEVRIIKNVISSDLEFLDCASTTGVRREKNEDFACCIQSPINEKIKLLLVCDGMGGFNHGEMASKIVAEEIVNWFNSYDFINDIESEIKGVIEECRKIIKKSYFMCGTTLTMAIILENATFIANIGDSRTYIIKGGILKQITKDDSEVWENFYEKGYFKKDDLRFLHRNNVLTAAIDDYISPVHLQTYYILNASYDGILLVSDGVTDILSDKSITRILNENDEADLLNNLLNEACLGDPESPPSCYYEVLYPTLPGKDNASAAVYLKKLVKNK